MKLKQLNRYLFILIIIYILCVILFTLFKTSPPPKRNSHTIDNLHDNHIIITQPVFSEASYIKYTSPSHHKRPLKKNASTSMAAIYKNKQKSVFSKPQSKYTQQSYLSNITIHSKLTNDIIFNEKSEKFTSVIIDTEPYNPNLIQSEISGYANLINKRRLPFHTTKSSPLMELPMKLTG